MSNELAASGQLSAEQIEDWRESMRYIYSGSEYDNIDALCDMALSSLRGPFADGIEPAINPTSEAADAFWRYWKANGETHKHGYYESTWGAINAALRVAGVCQHVYAAPSREDCKHGTSFRYVCEQCDIESREEIGSGQVPQTGTSEHQHERRTIVSGTDQRGTDEADNSGGQSVKSGGAGSSGARSPAIPSHPDRVATTQPVPHPQRESNSTPAPDVRKSKTGLTGSHPGAPTQDADELLREATDALDNLAEMANMSVYDKLIRQLRAHLSRKEQ